MDLKKAIEDLRKGRFTLLFDDEKREAETDLVIASEFVTPEAVRIMRQDGGGLICVTVDQRISERLGLPFLTDIYQRSNGYFPVLKCLVPDDIPYDTKSAFSLTVNHRRTFTGITDRDRALTISEFAKLCRKVDDLSPEEARNIFGMNFRSPGHVHLLNATDISNRRGHTELSTALLIMAGLAPSAAICEMMNGSDGNAMSRKEAMEYARRNNLAFLEGKEVIKAWKKYRGK